MTAGIPCQGFSKAGYRVRPVKPYNVLEDPRNHLYRVVVEWVKNLQPRYVVIENVPGIRTAGEDEANIVLSITKAFEQLDYEVDANIVNAVDFGIAQIRFRWIMIASRKDVEKVRVIELGDFHSTEKNLSDVISAMPILEANSGLWYMKYNNQVITGHRSRFNNNDDLTIYSAINPGERYIDFVTRRPEIIENRKNNSERAVYSTKSFPDKYKKLVPDEPSRTIVAHLQKDGNGYIHPSQNRSITPREAARIQAFDDKFIFTGSQGSQLIQTGNAIPPVLANAIARLLYSKLEKKS